MIDRTKKTRSTSEIEHSALEPYYISVDELNFSVHKRIPSGHKLQAKAHFQSLSKAVQYIIGIKVLNDLIDAKEVHNLEQFVVDMFNKVNDLLKQLDHDKIIKDAIERFIHSQSSGGN